MLCLWLNKRIRDRGMKLNTATSFLSCFYSLNAKTNEVTGQLSGSKCVLQFEDMIVALNESRRISGDKVSYIHLKWLWVFPRMIIIWSIMSICLLAWWCYWCSWLQYCLLSIFMTEKLCGSSVEAGKIFRRDNESLHTNTNALWNRRLCASMRNLSK